jgi:uncharacterized protein
VNDLILNVDALEEAQEPFEADLPRELLDAVLGADPPTEFQAAGASHIRGKATKLGRKVLVQARFTVPLQGTCRRCLKPLKLDEPVELTREYVPEPGADAAEDAAEATDEEVYAGKQIDLQPALREQILLSIPPSPLCRDECKGLCLKCGKDLNEGECGCDRSVADPRWAALKGIQLKTTKEK